jgi:hypothetical protein
LTPRSGGIRRGSWTPAEQFCYLGRATHKEGIMTKALEVFAMASGILGILLALAAGLGRLFGAHYLLGFESITLLTAAVASMAASCVVQLHLIRAR